MAKLTSSKKAVTTLTPPDMDTLVSIPVKLPASFVAALQTPGTTVGNSINAADAWDTYRVVFDAARDFAYKVVLPAEPDSEDEEQADLEEVEVDDAAPSERPKSCMKPGWEEKVLKENTRQEALEYDGDDSDDESGEVNEYGEVDENGELDEDRGRVGECSKDEDRENESEDGVSDGKEFEQEHEGNPEEADNIETGGPSGPTSPNSDKESDHEDEAHNSTQPKSTMEETSRSEIEPEPAIDGDDDAFQHDPASKKNSRKRSAPEPDMDDIEEPKPKRKRRRSSLQDLLLEVPKTYQLRSRKRKSLTKRNSLLYEAKSVFSPRNLRSRAKHLWRRKRHQSRSGVADRAIDGNGLFDEVWCWVSSYE